MQKRPVFKRYTVLIGNFGSGKTELALNLAMQAAAQGSTMLVDMDIINPYFKSSSKQEMLEAAGVRVVKPDYANTTMDVPTLPAEIYAPFDTRPDRAVFDIGGDPVGAAVLGLLREHFAKNAAESEFLFVVNPARPMQEDADAILSLLREIEGRAGICITGLVSNANLARETDMEVVRAGEAVTEELSRRTGLPVKFVALMESLAEAYTGEHTVFPITLYMRPAWLDEIV